jgi:hypothetical protein
LYIMNDKVMKKFRKQKKEHEKNETTQ